MKLALAGIVGAAAALAAFFLWALHRLEADLAGMRTL